MSFSLQVIEFDFTGEGPLRDLFASFTIENILSYVGTVIVFLKSQGIITWIIIVFFVLFGIRFAVNLIAAFRSTEEGLGPD